MRIFITGASGYIGHRLAVEASKRGFAAVALVRSATANRIIQNSSIEFQKGDITDFSSVLSAMAGCDYVFHTAALTQLWHKDPSLFYRVNIEGTRNVLEAAFQTGVKKLVFTSTCGVLGPSGSHPVKEDDLRQLPFENDYEMSKHKAEELVRNFVSRGLHAVIVRPSRVFGPGPLTQGNPINRLIKNTLRRGIAFMPSAKETIGNYAYIDDVVNGHFLALEKGKVGEVYNIGGENRSYQQLFSTIASEAKKKMKIVSVPISLLKAWASLVFGFHFILGRHTHLSPKVIDRLVQNRAVSCEKAIQELGYTITPFRQAIAYTIRHLKESDQDKTKA